MYVWIVWLLTRNAEAISFGDERLLINADDLYVVNALDIGNGCASTRVGEAAILSDCLGLHAR